VIGLPATPVIMMAFFKKGVVACLTFLLVVGQASSCAIEAALATIKSRERQ